jgi:hypothetical protein
MSERFYFRQLLAGRDFALDDPVAGPMANYCYLIGDRERGEAVAVDPAYRVRELVAQNRELIAPSNQAAGAPPSPERPRDRGFAPRVGI